jgi:CHAT domain-containing protein/tetratricopeptide (TPR) repeat protein
MLEPLSKKKFGRFSLCIAVVSLLLGGVPCHSNAETATDSARVGRMLLERGLELLNRQSYDSAYSYCDQASRLLKGTDWESYLTCSSGKSNVLVAKGRIDSAETLTQRAFSLAAPHVSENSLGVAETYSFFSYFHSYRDRPDSAIVYDRHSLSIRLEVLGRNNPLLARNFYTLGLAYRKKGLYGEATSHLREALRLCSVTSGKSAFAANILMSLGNVLRERADYDEAARCLDSSLNTLRMLGLERSHSMITGMIYLATCRAEAGQFDQAVALYDSAAALAGAIDPTNQALMVSLRTSAGNVYAEMGDYDRALDAFDEGLLRTQKYNFGAASSIGEIHQFSAAVLVEKGDFSSALNHAKSALRLKSEALGKDHPDVATAHEVLSDVAEGSRDHPNALKHLQEALRIRLLVRGGSGRTDLANLLIKMAAIHVANGQSDSATSMIEKAAIYLENPPEKNPALWARMHEVEADIGLARKMPARAVELYDSAIALLMPERVDPVHVIHDSPVDLARGIHLLRILRKKGMCLEDAVQDAASATRRLSSALQAYGQASRTVLALRASYESEGSKFRLLEQFSDIFERGIRAALRLRGLTRNECYLDSAFYFAELSKAGILLEGIRDARVREFAGVPRDLLLRERGLKTRLTASEIQLSKALDQPAVDSARVRALRWNALSLREELRLATENLRRTYPSYSRLIACDTLPLLASLRRAIDDSTLVVEYVLGDTTAYMFVIGNHESNVHVLHSSKRIAAAAAALTRSIRTIDREGFLIASELLYAYVISPFGRSLASHSRLIIVPDKELSSVPFEVLLPPSRVAPHASSGFAALPYLIKSHEIAMSPTARLLCDCGNRPIRETDRVMNFAGFAPVFRESTATGVILASNRYANSLDTAELRSISVNGKRFRELAYSDAEVMGIAGEFAKRDLQAQAFISGSATEENFKRTAPHFSYLHVATHGFVNERDPSRSALVFAQPGDTANDEDGVLYAAEAYNLNLDAELVVLSSCESGIGRFVAGEGVYALMRGFLYSGARNIIYSLWQVLDHHTSELMQSFYNGVLNGRRFGKALQMAKIQMLSRERTAFPFAWAGFALIGQ